SSGTGRSAARCTKSSDDHDPSIARGRRAHRASRSASLRFRQRFAVAKRRRRAGGPGGDSPQVRAELDAVQHAARSPVTTTILASREGGEAAVNGTGRSAVTTTTRAHRGGGNAAIGSKLSIMTAYLCKTAAELLQEAHRIESTQFGSWMFRGQGD